MGDRSSVSHHRSNMKVQPQADEATEDRGLIMHVRQRVHIQNLSPAYSVA
jgi:hypothetical protein